MAPNNKKNKGRTNKKNKNRGGSTGGRNNNNTAHQGKENEITIKDNLPIFHQSSNDDGGGGGYYDIYKRSTTKFWNWMKVTLPNRKMNAVDDLCKGVNEFHERTLASLQQVGMNELSNFEEDGGADTDADAAADKKEIRVAPKYIIDELSKSIRYRQLVTDNRFVDNSTDEGHQYMINALRYCRNILKYGRRVAKIAAIDQQQQNKSENEDNDDVRISHGFLAMTIDDDSDDEDEDDSDKDEITIDVDKIRDGTLESPFESPEEGEEIDIETLINGDDRFQACALLNTMDDYMGTIHQHYGLLKNHLRGHQALGYHQASTNKDDDDGILKLLMECTVVANMATESIQSAENSLKINHPHISSFYHVMTIVFLPNFVVDLEKILVENNNNNKNTSDNAYGKFENQLQRRHAMIDFVAKIVESAFHSTPTDDNSHVTGIVKAFTRKYGIKSKTDLLDREFAQPILYYMMMQNPLAMEESNNRANAEMARASGMEAHSLLKRSSFIGGDSCILNTQNILQKLLDVSAKNSTTKLVSKTGFWGSTFDEMTNPARRIRGDLDEIFAGCIVPELITLCARAPFQFIHPHLLPMIDMFQQHIKKDKTAPVPISVSFSFHALLTSIFVLQGDNDLARIASLSKQSYNKLFSQLDVLSEPSKDPQNAPVFYQNVSMYKQIVNFAKPEPIEYDQFQRQQQSVIDPVVVERLAFWNPLLGGEYMLLCTYLCSIGLGSATVDTLGQLRFTLHLYNALKQHDPSSLLGNVPFLKKIDTLFSKTKSVWVGGCPNKGSYAKHFFMSWGHSITNATLLASDSTPKMKAYQKALANNSNMTRNLRETLPENYSASYQNVVQHIFTDDMAAREYTVRNTMKESEKRYGGLSDLLTRVNMTRDSMDEDEDYFSMNLTAVGCILLKFTNELSKVMGWDEMVTQTLLKNPKLRTGKSMGGKRMKQGTFLTSDLNIKRQGIAYIWGTLLSQLDTRDNNDTIKLTDIDVDKVASFMNNFFLNIRREEYIYFVKESELSSTRRNPLEGPYPYGRTGMTIRDPLQGFTSYQLSKAGKPIVRLIKPGKLTPFVPDEEGYATPPVYWQGNKLPPLPNGKYRHIASYTLNELIDLG